MHTALFARQVTRTPSAPALIATACSLTYEELDRRSNRLAHQLRGIGVGVESVVGLCADSSPDAVVGALAIMKAGGAYLALDPALPADRLAYMLADAGVKVVLTGAGKLSWPERPGIARVDTLR